MNGGTFNSDGDMTLGGVTTSSAALAVIVQAPIDEVWLYAYELHHPALAESIRFVNDKAALFATLEIDAPWDAGAEVEFLACPMSAARPAETDDAANPAVVLSRNNVSGLLKRALDTARAAPAAKWTLIERAYVTSDLSRPAQLPPLSYIVTSIEMAGAGARITAQYDDDANIGVPRITFTRANYPGLKR